MSSRRDSGGLNDDRPLPFLPHNPMAFNRLMIAFVAADILTTLTRDVVQGDILYSDHPAVVVLMMKSKDAVPAPPLFLPFGKTRLPACINTAKPSQVTQATSCIKIFSLLDAALASFLSLTTLF